MDKVYSNALNYFNLMQFICLTIINMNNDPYYTMIKTDKFDQVKNQKTILKYIAKSQLTSQLLFPRKLNKISKKITLLIHAYKRPELLELCFTPLEI